MTSHLNVNNVQIVGSFPWYRLCHLRITATGMIWSGVVCTGLNPPGGWGGWRVREEETDWPCRGGLACRFGLIGSLDEGRNWFWVAEGVTKFAVDPPDHLHTATLRLAINVPTRDLIRGVPADHSFTVDVETFEPGMIGVGDPELCRSIASQLADLRSINAPTACDEAQRTRMALQERQHQMEVAFEVAGGLAIGLTVVASAPFIAQELAQHGVQRAAVEVLRNILTHALESLNPLLALISAAITGIAVGAGARSAATAARSATSPVTANLVMAIIVAALIIAMVAAFVTAIAMALSLLTLGADRDNAISRWNAVINDVQSLLAFNHQACNPPFDETLPTCAGIGG